MNAFIIGSAKTVGGPSDVSDTQSTLDSATRHLGRTLASAGHTAIVCSPFAGCADQGIIEGYCEAARDAVHGATIEFHHIDTVPVRERLDEIRRLATNVTVRTFAYAPPADDTPEALGYAWLLCQLSALDRAHVTIAIGGRLGGSTNLLLLVAEGRRVPLLPTTFLGGAARQCFFRRQYELRDRFHDDVEVLHHFDQIDKVVRLAERFGETAHGAPPRLPAAAPPQFFISYARARPAEADRIETILRRRNVPVFRDESDFGAGHEVVTQISEAIHRVDVVVVAWCREYACSPWCFDEFDLALNRHAEGKVALWIFSLDGTRIVPKRARDLIFYPVTTRDELEGRVLQLLEPLLSGGTSSDAKGEEHP